MSQNKSSPYQFPTCKYLLTDIPILHRNVCNNKAKCDVCCRNKKGWMPFAYLCEGSTYLLSDESQLESPIITVKASLCVQLHPWPLTLFILYHTKGILMFISLLH